MCRWQLAQLRTLYPELQQRGAEILLVTPTSNNRARGYVETLKLDVDFPYLTDASATVFDLFQVPKSLLRESLGYLRSAAKRVFPTPGALVTRFDRDEAREILTGRLDGFFLIDKSGVLRQARCGFGVGTLPPNEETLSMVEAPSSPAPGP